MSAVSRKELIDLSGHVGLDTVLQQCVRHILIPVHSAVTVCIHLNKSKAPMWCFRNRRYSVYQTKQGRENIATTEQDDAMMKPHDDHD